MRLKEIRIALQQYGEHKGKYQGTITFEDGTSDVFTFGLTPEVCAKYLEPIAKEVINSGKQLGDKLAESFTRELEQSTLITVAEANKRLTEK